MRSGDKVGGDVMTTNYINRLCQICLDIAEYYDSKGDEEKKFLRDDMIDSIGLGYRALTAYLRKGVQEVVTLQGNYHSAREKANYEKSIQESQREYLLDVFGDDEPYSINDRDKQRIKDFVQSIFKEWEEEEKEE